MNLDFSTRTIAGRPIRSCKSCNAPIVWFKTDAGNSMPVEAGSVAADDLKLDLSRHKSHFATCPNADQHRKTR